MNRSTLLKLWPVPLLALLLALSACVRPAPGSENLPVSTAIPGTNATPLLTTPIGIATLPADFASPTPITVISTPTPPVAVTIEPGVTVPGVGALPTQHTVQAGETLSSIAQRYGVPAADIQATNNILDPNSLAVGTVLTIPAPGTVAVATATPMPTGEQIHIVQQGENLYRIGLRYGFTPQELAAYNGLGSVDLIYVGQEIKIPPK